MRIGVDCLRADPGYVGGLNTYIHGLLGGFAAVGGRHRFQLYVTDENQGAFARYATEENFEVFAVHGRGLRWRQNLCRTGLLARNPDCYRRMSGWLFRPMRQWMEAGSDLIYTPTVSLLCFDHRKPTLLSMHDIQYLHYPEFFSWPERRSREITCALSARNATYFQASSQFIKRDLLAHFPEISPQQIAVIPEGVNLAGFSAPRGSGVVERHGLPDRFLFLPAQLWPHKNHLTVLGALRQLRLEQGVEIPLVMTGARYSAAPNIFRYVKAEQMNYVRYLGIVAFDELVELYQRAALVVAPGLYESNSLPVLEAAAAGTAVIASRIPPNQELAQVLHLNLFDARDEPALAGLILELWRDPESCRAQAAHNRAQVVRFSWENAARQYLGWIERMGNSNASPDAASPAARGCVHA
jgi:glycosyltransferase involved in cell wall biosynthesis